jgi:hypothetical protein
MRTQRRTKITKDLIAQTTLQFGKQTLSVQNIRHTKPIKLLENYVRDTAGTKNLLRTDTLTVEVLKQLQNKLERLKYLTQNGQNNRTALLNFINEIIRQREAVQRPVDLAPQITSLRGEITALKNEVRTLKASKPKQQTPVDLKDIYKQIGSAKGWGIGAAIIGTIISLIAGFLFGQNISGSQPGTQQQKPI